MAIRSFRVFAAPIGGTVFDCQSEPFVTNTSDDVFRRGNEFYTVFLDIA
jgi:hypothetical protein